MTSPETPTDLHHGGSGAAAWIDLSLLVAETVVDIAEGRSLAHLSYSARLECIAIWARKLLPGAKTREELQRIPSTPSGDE